MAVNDAEDLLDNLTRRMREDQDAGAGFALGGQDPYADDWDLDLALGGCPDQVPTANSPVDAWLVVGKPSKTGRLRSSGLKRIHVTSAGDLQALREASGWKMREDWAPDPFAYGQSGSMGGGGPLAAYLPLWPGPVTRQLYWQDYFAMSAKAFEAYNHDPLSWRCVHMKQEFALGKGLEGSVTISSGSKAGKKHDRAQAVWDEFWTRNKMDSRLDMLARDLSIMGEQFLRFFQKGRALTVRSLDPASIYDLITDPEDLETVFAYHQQFQTPYQLYPPKGATPPGQPQSPFGPTAPGAATKYIVRQILPQEIDHYRINTGAYERRGRSDLFPGLGWIKRLRDYLTSKVIREDMLSRICWDLVVQGNQGALNQAKAALFPNGQAPPPGTVFGHTDRVQLNALVPSSSMGGSRWDPVLDGIVTMIANSVGLPKDWLGFSQGGTRANALVATEPAARSLEELQGTIETILQSTFERVMRAANIVDADVEFTFPSIASEDRTQKLQDLSYAEANGWISKQTAATIAAKELGITSYDFEEELGLIAEEFPEPEMEDIPDAEPNPVTGKKPQRPVQGDGKVRRSVIIATNRQAAKLDITKSPSQEDEPPGLLVPTDGSEAPVPGQPPLGGGNGGPSATNGGPPPAPKSRAGMPADENPMSGAGAKNIKADMAETQGRRRRPDDPEFQAAAEAYKTASAANLAALTRDVSTVREGAPVAPQDVG